jgi:flagellar M-ring protein FliF
VAGIVHLVASSVPQLAPKQVSVIDQTGTLLSADGEGSANGLDASQLNYVRRIESVFSQRVLDIVEPIVGAGNVRAQVTADIDFTQSESTAELYRPNQNGQPAAVRSQQVLESGARDAGGAQGVPGAVSNQPPAPASAPVNGPAQATQAANPQANAGTGAGRREAVTNYELDKTVRVTRDAPGTIKRLSAAIVVNHRRSVDEDGKPVLTALTPAEVENINALVRDAIGFNRERGDSINVVNAAFSEPEPVPVVETPAWQQPENLALATDLGKQALLVVLALVVILTLIRPALRTFARPVSSAPGLAARIDDPLQLPEPPVAGALPAPLAAQSQDAILKMARDNPAAVAHIVRGWVGSQPKGG